MKRHPYFTYEILARVPVFSEFAYDASCHHERIDGRGYHRGVPGDGLSTSARIMATADIFDALSAERPALSLQPHGDDDATINAASLSLVVVGAGIWIGLAGVTLLIAGGES